MVLQKPGTWQRKAVDGIVARMTGARPARAALLQLPTGFGKSLVAVGVYAKLRERRPDLRLMIVLPKEQTPPVGWVTALGYRQNDCLDMFEWLSPPAVKGWVCFQTRHELKKAMLCRSSGWPPWLASDIHRYPHLVVVDEVHKHRRVLEALAGIFLEPEAEERRAAEWVLTKPFRSPARGRRTWPKWLLLSATPFNPVSLDEIDPPDLGRADETFQHEDGRDEEALATEIEKTLGALGYLAGRDLGDWFTRHVVDVRARLSGGQLGKPVRPPRELVVWPAVARQRSFQPPAKRRWGMATPVVRNGDLRSDVCDLVGVAESLERGAAWLVRRRATTERLVLSGGNLEVVGHRIAGETYSGSLARCVARAVGGRRKSGLGRPAKLQGLVELVCGPAAGQNVLVFCVHRAVAVAVYRELQLVLEASFQGSRVRAAVGSVSDRDRGWFNKSAGGKTRVLVATDACSESIDLHEKANVLIHYELPWSPLRVLQRVGRLWRIRRGEIKKGQRPTTPRLPGIVHFAHPGSVDEEILSRLWRRWGHLRVMGLDYLSYEQALGIRLPAVSWQPGGSA